MASAPIYPSARVEVTTYNAFLKKEVDLTVRKNPFLAALQEKGRITKNWKRQGGPEVVWDVRYRSMEPEVGEDMTPIGMPRDNLWKQCKLPWRRYFKGQSVSKFEKLINGGSNSIVKIIDKLYPTQVKSIMDRLARDIFNNDGNSTSEDHSRRVHGFPSWMAGTGTIVNQNGSGNGLVEDPSDFYAGLYTNLGYYGGSWTVPSGSEWPVGTGNYEYQFFSPMKIDVENSMFPGSNHTWAGHWRHAMNFAITYFYAQHAMQWDAFFLSPEALRIAKDSLDVGNGSTLFIQRGPAESILVKLGFSVISYEGVDLIADHNIAANNVFGYGVVFDKLELRALQSELIEKEDDQDITVSSDLIVADSYLNLAIESPAYSCAFVGGISEV